MKNSPPCTPEIKNALRKLLKKMALVLLLFALFPLPAAELSPVEAANRSFAEGKFADALDVYKRELREHDLSVTLLYNIGNTEFRLGNFPAARGWLLRAYLLSPRDSEILENLNLVNRKLLLPELGKTGTPRQLLIWCRDRFRPDQNLLIGSGAWFLLCLLFVFRRRLTPMVRYYAGGLLILVIALYLAAYTSQIRGMYHPDNGVLLGKNVELRSLPSSVSGKAECIVPGGSNALRLDRRDHWIRVNVNGRDGWIRESEFFPLLP